MGKSEREKLIASASAAVRKEFKSGISERADKALELPSVFVSTGSLALDRLCAGRNPGGIPIGPTQGRVVHIAGEWSTGKSLILDHLFLSCQRLGGLTLCSETEVSRDTHFANAIWLDLKLLEIQRPDTLEELFDMGLTWHDDIRKQDATIPIIWGLDSVDSTEAEKAADKGMSEGGGWKMGGGKSEALGAGLRKVVKRCSRYPTTFVIINQTRDNVGTFFGPKKRTSGGNAPHFYASVELMLSPSSLGLVRGTAKLQDLPQATLKRLGLQYAEPDVVGRWVRGKLTKTKVAPTFMQEADFYIDFRKGVHKWGGLQQALLREGKMELDTKGEGIRLKVGDTIAEFKGLAEWLGWQSKNEEYLEALAYE